MADNGNNGKGGIGGSGVGWQGSGSESRNQAAHRGADFGGRRGTVGGGGHSPGGVNQNSRGPTEKGAARRAAALSAFDRTKQTVSSVLDGLAEIGSEIGEKTADVFGYEYDPEPTFKGSQDVGELNAHIEAQKEKGRSLAVRDQTINTVASVGGLNVATDLATNAMSQNLSETAKMQYDDTKAKGLGSLSRMGVGLATGLLKTPTPIVSTVTNAVSLAKMTEQTKPDRVQASRRSRAIATFSPTRGSSSSQSALASRPPQSTSNWMWEPASYGVGEYGSHVQGLLRS